MEWIKRCHIYYLFFEFLYCIFCILFLWISILILSHSPSSGTSIMCILVSSSWCPISALLFSFFFIIFYFPFDWIISNDQSSDLLILPSAWSSWCLSWTTWYHWATVRSWDGRSISQQACVSLCHLVEEWNISGSMNGAATSNIGS